MPPCLLFLAASKYCSAQACQTHWGSTCWKLIQCIGFIWEQQKFEKTCLILAYCKEMKWNTRTCAVFFFFCILVYFWCDSGWFCDIVLTFIKRTKSYTLQWLQGPDCPLIEGDFCCKKKSLIDLLTVIAWSLITYTSIVSVFWEDCHQFSGPLLLVTFSTWKFSVTDLVMVFDAFLTSRQTCEKLQCLYENLMSNDFRKTAVLKKIWLVN